MKREFNRAKSFWIITIFVVLSALITIALCWHPHGISLFGSTEQIRASILKITPIGIPIEEVKLRIQTKLHPHTFYYFADGVAFPSGSDVAKGSKIVYDQPQIKHPRKAIVCEIGEGSFLDMQDVGAYWFFDGSDCLVDVFVDETANMP